MATGDEIDYLISDSNDLCNNCGWQIVAGDPVAEYRGEVICEVCADHKEGELMFYGEDLQDAEQ